MNKNIIYCGIFLVFLIGISIFLFTNKNELQPINELNGQIINLENDLITIKDTNNDVYTFKSEIDGDVGSDIHLKYQGTLNKNNDIQEVTINDYEVIALDENNDLFKDYYDLADKKLATMSTDEKIGQILLVRYPDDNQIADLKKYQFAGFVFFSKDFKDKDENAVKQMISNLQNNSKIPLLTAVDEEGGKIVRISNNAKLVKEPFKSPRDLYNEGGFDLIKEDTINKSKILYNLGINLNLAPVVDIATSPEDYMYDRSIGLDASKTSTFAKTVIQASKNKGVSYTLKHFPGYGNNSDTHLDTSTDNRTLEDIMESDILPFQSGIEVGAEAVLVSHNTIKNIEDTPASLSKKINNLLTEELKFTGVIISDNLDMGAVAGIKDVIIKAIKAGNDLIITTDYENQIKDIKEALDDKTLTIEEIDNHVKKILAWKYYKGLIIDNQK